MNPGTTKEDIDFIGKNPNYVKIDSSSWMVVKCGKKVMFIRN